MSSPVASGGPDWGPRDDRAAADGELFRLLEKANFEGREWVTLSERLCLHGLAVLHPWAATGMIFQKLAAKGRPLHPTAAERDAVMKLPEELSNTSVAIALRNFQDRARAGCGWTPDGGASLETYFISGCLDVFANEFRRLRRSSQLVPNDIPAASDDLTALLERRMSGNGPCEPDVESAVANRDAIRRWLHSFDECERLIIWGKANGLTNTGIVPLLRARSAKAVERRWSRMLEKEPRLRAIRGKEDS